MEETRGRKARVSRAEAARLEKEGKTRAAIAKELGCAPSYLSALLGPKRGAAAPGSSSEKVARIKQLLRKGLRKSEIQAELQCSYALIQGAARALAQGGRWVYKPKAFGVKRSGRLEERNTAILAEHRRGAALAQLAQQHHLSERTIRHILQGGK